MEEKTCQHCGASVPRAALRCPRCGQPTYVLSARRQRRRRDASVVGLVGSLVMAVQSASMLIGGALALYALDVGFSGDHGRALSIAETAIIFIGTTILFDLLGVALLIYALQAHTREVRANARLAAAESEPRRLALFGSLAVLFFVLWLFVTIAWRISVAAILSVYPSPLGGSLETVGISEVRGAASIMLGLWVGAALLFFLGATFAIRFLQGLRKAPTTLPRLLWPSETFLHFCTAVVILLVAPSMLIRTTIDLESVRIVETLGFIDLVVVPIIGVLAYTFLAREFRALMREASRSPEAPAPDSPEPSMEPPSEKT